MAYTVTDSGVTLRTGRGSGAVEISVSFKEIEAWAKKMHANEPRLWRLAYGRACSGLKKKLVNVMLHRGGECGVPKFRNFEEFTNSLRGINNNTQPMGGVLSQRATIVSYKRNGAQVIGWHDNLKETAENFQEGRGGPDSEKWFTDPRFRRIWHKRGLKDIPPAYVHNERMVLEPYFHDYIRAHLDEWARGAFFKGLAKLMMGGNDSAFERYVYGDI